MKPRRNDILIHAVLLVFAGLTLLPFAFVINNAFRTNTEMNHAFFALPAVVKNAVAFTWFRVSGQDERIQMRDEVDESLRVRAVDTPLRQLSYGQAMGRLWFDATKGFRYAWRVLRPYMLNSFIVCIATVLSVVTLASISAYVFSRYRFPGHKFLFLVVLSFMMIPGILTLVPSFLLVKKLGLLNSYWVLILPYITAGQVMAIFLFKGFFDGLPHELFEAARIDGASHVQQYWHIVLPLSKQIIAVVAIINFLGAWNNFLWPYITNSDQSYHVIASGLFQMTQSQVASNQSTMFAAYILSSIPLIVLFTYATRPFMAGVTSGAFKA